MIGGPEIGRSPERRLTRSDVGRRVSVRRLEEVVAGRPVYRDVIGVLASWDDHGLTVVPRSGEPVVFAEERLVAGKPVPLFPARAREMPTASPVELQRLADRAWPAVEQESLGAWKLRAAAGFTKRADSVQTLGDPGMPLERALDAVRDWYAARGLPPYVEVTWPGTAPEVVEELDRLAPRVTPVAVRTAPLAPLCKLGSGHERVRLSRTAGPDWMAQYHRFSADDAALARAAAEVLHGGPSVWFATVPGPQAPLAIGRCVIDGPWAFFGAVEVAPYARRAGLATTVMAVLAARAAEEGAYGAYLQVEADNAGAEAMYDRLGFETSHTYHYVRLPQR
jgi:GNAT superfamily N-acetyltransferase